MARRITAMRYAIVAVLVAWSSLAQPRVSAETQSEPLQSHGALALSRDAIGVVVAWSGDDRISVARLDATGHVTGAVHELSTRAADPALAPLPGGIGFTIVWRELAGHFAYARLDENLAPSAPRFLPDGVADAPLVVSGTDTWMLAGGHLSQLLADGTRIGRDRINGSASDMTLVRDYPRVIASDKSQTPHCTSSAPECHVSGGPFNGACLPACTFYTSTAAMRVIAGPDDEAETVFPFDSDAKAAIEADGDALRIAWFDGANVMATTVDTPVARQFERALRRARVIGNAGNDSGATRPDIASDASSSGAR